MKNKILRIIKKAIIVVAIIWFTMVLIGAGRKWYFDKTDSQIARIHSTKLSIDDVMGKNLPPDPGIEADKTIEGIDVNENGIRDDVELAIFKEYPNSAKTRAVLLQYALALQMQTGQGLVNKATVTEVITENSRSHSCISDTLVPRATPESSRTTAEVDKIYTYIDFVENQQFNTDARKKANQEFYSRLGSYSESTNIICDIDLSLLSN